MTDLKLVDRTDPVLTTPSKEFDFKNPPFNPVEFSHALVAFMYENHGLGLAAPQVGVPYRIFAMRGNPENFVCINPRVVMPSEEQVVLEEGCLTWKGLFVKVKRPQHVRVRFQTPNGETRTDTFTGMSARVFQHEMDHLEGVWFFNRANRYHRDKAMKKWKEQNEV